MLIEIESDLSIESDFILIISAVMLKSTFWQTRIKEGIDRGKIIDASMRRRKGCLIFYPSGQGVILSTSKYKVEKALKTTREKMEGV